MVLISVDVILIMNLECLFWNVLRRILAGILLQVIKEIQLMKENCWFATHLTDLLYHSGCLESDDPEVDKQ